MKTKILLFLFVLMGNTVQSIAQNNQISLLYGFGSYQMTELKKLQKQNLSTIDPSIPARVVEDFPANNYLQGAWKFSLNERYRMGFVLGFNTTGSRIHYADYTGEVAYEIVAKACNIGIDVERVIFQMANFEFVIDANFSIYSSVIKSENKLTILNNSYSTTVKYESISPTLEPGVSINYSIKSFFIGMHGGYLLDPGARLFSNYSDPYPAYFYEYRGSRSNWTGIRIGVVGGFFF